MSFITWNLHFYLVKPALIPTVYSNSFQPGVIWLCREYGKVWRHFWLSESRNKEKNATKPEHRTDAQDRPAQQSHLVQHNHRAKVEKLLYNIK